MNEQKYKRIINKFFRNELPDSVQSRFQKWFLYTEETTDLDPLLNDLFDEVPDQYDKRVDVNAHLARFKQKYQQSSPNELSLWRRVSKIAIVLLLPLITGVLTYLCLPAYMEPEMVQVSTQRGTQRIIQLSDGSVVWLNSGSALIYPKQFKSKQRLIHLIGEGRFKVTKNPDKPFIVQTNFQKVEALGTVFTVQSYPDALTSRVCLEEGSVRCSSISSDKETYILFPDQEAVYNNYSKTTHIKKVDAVKLGSWYKGELNFDSATLGEIIKTLEMQYDVDFIYDPSFNHSNQLNVKFSKTESLESILDILIRLTDYNSYTINNGKVELNK